MKNRIHFSFRIDMWTDDGENVIEHLAAARERWPKTAITLRQGARVIEDSRRTWTAAP